MLWLVATKERDRLTPLARGLDLPLCALAPFLVGSRLAYELTGTPVGGCGFPTTTWDCVWSKLPTDLVLHPSVPTDGLPTLSSLLTSAVKLWVSEPRVGWNSCWGPFDHLLASPLNFGGHDKILQCKKAVNRFLQYQTDSIFCQKTLLLYFLLLVVLGVKAPSSFLYFWLFHE